MKEVSIFSWRASSCWSPKDDSSNENMRSAAAEAGCTSNAVAAAVDQLWGVVELERATSRHFSSHDRARIYFRRFSKNYSGNILDFGMTKLFPYYARHNFRTPNWRSTQDAVHCAAIFAEGFEL